MTPTVLMNSNEVKAEKKAEVLILVTHRRRVCAVTLVVTSFLQVALLFVVFLYCFFNAGLP